MRLLDPGVFVEEKSEMPNIFFLSSSSFAFPFFFSLIALQLHDPKILGKHPGSAALLSWSPSQSTPTHPPPFALRFLVPSTASVTCNVLLINLFSWPYIYIFFFFKKYKWLNLQNLPSYYNILLWSSWKCNKWQVPLAIISNQQKIFFKQ